MTLIRFTPDKRRPKEHGVIDTTFLFVGCGGDGAHCSAGAVWLGHPSGALHEPSPEELAALEMHLTGFHEVRGVARALGDRRGVLDAALAVLASASPAEIAALKENLDTALADTLGRLTAATAETADAGDAIKDASAAVQALKAEAAETRAEMERQRQAFNAERAEFVHASAEREAAIIKREREIEAKRVEVASAAARLTASIEMLNALRDGREAAAGVA
jgi:hypothetical protein